LVVALVGKGVRCRALWRPGSGSKVDAGLERGRGRGVLVLERSRDSRGLLTDPKTSKSCNREGSALVDDGFECGDPTWIELDQEKVGGRRWLPYDGGVVEVESVVDIG